jgi:hypothetical protein
MVLTIASLLCLILVFSAQLNQKNEIQTSLYFFKVRCATNWPPTPSKLL